MLNIRTYVFLLLMFSASGLFAQEHRSRLSPDYYKVQYAGNIGFVSIAAGYNNKHQTLEGDFFYGYVPKSVGGDHIHTLTSKLNYQPIEIKWKENDLRPLYLGIMVSYTFGKQYFGFTPDKYPYNYYKFPTSIHLGLQAGAQYNRKLPGKRFFRNMGIYAEFTSYDAEVLSYVNNPRSLSFIDILSLGIGVRLGR